jgi:O-succinylbenzoic acid--CoA ligase
MKQPTLDFTTLHNLNLEGIRQDARQLIEKWLSDSDTFTFQTSGSTGKPKEISFHRNQLIWSAQSGIQAISLSGNDHVLHCLSAASVGGAMLLIRAILVQCKISFINPSLHPLKAIDAKHPFTVASFVPSQVHDIIEGQREFNKLNQFSKILIGGAALSFPLEKMMANMPPHIYHTYGMTETLSHVALRRAGHESNYTLLPGNEIKVNEEGMLMIKSPATNEQWLTTNDMVTLVDEKTFTVNGRADRVINSGGIKINAETVEEELNKAEVLNKRFFITAENDDVLGQKVVLFIEDKPWDEFALNIFFETMQHALPKYHVPKMVHFTPHFFETESGKVDMIRTINVLNN